ncbi:MAG: methyltransferase domain-containing protein [Longimicrobiales bacterium]
MIRALALSLHERSHERRARLFLRYLRPPPGASLLDLGGGSGSFAARLTRRVPLDVTVADIATEHRTTVQRRRFRFVHLEEDRPLPFGDRAFDIVLCNSVIEHVTLPKQELIDGAPLAEPEWRRLAFDRQRAFAAEIERVARAYFVQTPHRDFPLDLHLWLPFTNWLPHPAVDRLTRFADRWWIKKNGAADWNLLRPADMRELFPGSLVLVERALGLPKSILALRRGL